MGISKEDLAAIGKDFVEETKLRLKDHWDSFPEQTKQDIQATGIFAAQLATKIAIAGPEGYKVERAHLDAQLASIKVIGTLEFQSQVFETLDAAAKISGTVLQKVLMKALLGI